MWVRTESAIVWSVYETCRNPMPEGAPKPRTYKPNNLLGVNCQWRMVSYGYHSDMFSEEAQTFTATIIGRIGFQDGFVGRIVFRTILWFGQPVHVHYDQLQK